MAINFDEWSKQYQQIIKNAKRLSKDTVDLLERLNKQIFDYDTGSFNDRAAILTAMCEMASALVETDEIKEQKEVCNVFLNLLEDIRKDGKEEELEPQMKEYPKFYLKAPQDLGANIEKLMSEHYNNIHCRLPKQIYLTPGESLCKLSDSLPFDIYRNFNNSNVFMVQTTIELSLKYLVIAGNLSEVKKRLSCGEALYEGIMDDAINSNHVDIVQYLNEEHSVPLPTDIPTRLQPVLHDKVFEYLAEQGVQYSLADKIVLEKPEYVSKCIDRGDSLDAAFEMENEVLEKDVYCKPATLKQYYFPHYAVMHAAPKSLLILIANGLDIHCKDSNGQTPLHYAAKELMCRNMKVLIVAGADINEQDELGRTPLHVLAGGLNSSTNEEFRFYMHLVNEGANQDLKDNDEHTPRNILYSSYGSLNPGVLFMCTNGNNEEKTNAQSGSDTVESLVHLSAIAVANNREFTKGLGFRKKLPTEVIDKVEEAILSDVPHNLKMR